MWSKAEVWSILFTEAPEDPNLPKEGFAACSWEKSSTKCDIKEGNLARVRKKVSALKQHLGSLNSTTRR
jgi:hypothetical protein